MREMKQLRIVEETIFAYTIGEDRLLFVIKSQRTYHPSIHRAFFLQRRHLHIQSVVNAIRFVQITRREIWQLRLAGGE